MKPVKTLAVDQQWCLEKWRRNLQLLTLRLQGKGLEGGGLSWEYIVLEPCNENWGGGLEVKGDEWAE